MSRSNQPTVAIIGAGVVGQTLALSLADTHQVTLFDRQQPGQEASWAGGGILSPLYFWQYDEAVLALCQDAVSDYAQLAEQLRRTTGIDVHYRACQLRIHDELDTSTRQQISQLSHYYRCQWQQRPEYHPLLSSLVAQIRNPRLMKALNAEVNNRGIKLRVEAQLQLQREPQTSTVKIGLGASTFAHFDEIVVCAGAWSSKLLDPLLSPLGLHLPVKPIRGQMLALKCNDPAFSEPHVDMKNGVYVIPRPDGIVVIGSTLEDVGFDQSTTQSARNKLYQQALELRPELEGAEQVKHWAGLRPSSPKNIPVIAKVPVLKNLSISTGHFRYGITMALNSAKIMKQLLLEGEYPEPFAHLAEQLEVPADESR